MWSAQLTGPLPATTTTSADDLATPQHNFTGLATGRYSVRLVATVKNGEVVGASTSRDITGFVIGLPGKSEFVTAPAQVAGKLRLKWTPAANDPDPDSTMCVPAPAPAPAPLLPACRTAGACRVAGARQQLRKRRRGKPNPPEAQ